MPEIFINGQPVQAEPNQTVMQVALANGFVIPSFCWHPALSIAGNCRICVVQAEGNDWVQIACNMPVSEGLRILTDSELVRANRKGTMQFLTERFEGLDEEPETHALVASAVAAEQVTELLDEGVTEFHIYTHNRSPLALALARILGRRPEQ